MNDIKLKHTFEKGLGTSLDNEFESLEFGKSEKWDSIAHMRLIAAIEEDFIIRLEVDDILGMNSFIRAKEIINKHLHEKG
jgi:acyl carrier protein